MRKVGLVIALLLLGACSQTSPENSVTESASAAASPVRLIGRFDQEEESVSAFTWPASAMAFRFSGTEASITLQSSGRIRFQVVVDGEPSDLWVKEGIHRYSLATGLNEGEHDVRLTRLGESFEGVTAFASLPQVDGELLPAPKAPGRRLLFLGDSITAGYGVEGRAASCPYAQETSNPTLTYASIAANALEADAHLIAWSGIGVWRSYGEEQAQQPTLMDRRQRTLALEARPRWNVARYQPQAVIVAIGTNDYWTGSAPGYEGAMRSLLTHLHQDYSGVPLYLMASPMLTGEARESQVSVLQSLANENVHFLDLGKIDPEEGYGCDYHPNAQTHARLGHNLRAVLKKDLGW